MLTAIQFQGNLLAADITNDLLTANIKGQTPEDFGLPKSDKLEDEIAIVWGYAKAYWTDFNYQLNKLSTEDTATSITREVWVVPLLRRLGYFPLYTPKAEVVDNQTYAISHRAASKPDPSITNHQLLITNYPPIHIIGCRLELDKRPPSGNPRLSAHSLVQEYLNKTEHLWAIVTNGFRWRLLRDSSLMTRNTYIEFDLEQILNGENFAEFSIFYRLFHRSRLPETAEDADKCLLEYYHQESLQQGGRVREKLRIGVEKALILLGNGFLQYSDTGLLYSDTGLLYSDTGLLYSDTGLLREVRYLGEVSDTGLLREVRYLRYYRQLLRLIYRLLFLMVAESRNLLLTENDPEKARIYLEYYSIERLRELAERPYFRREGFQDIWQGLRVTFQLFNENWRGEILGLSPLNGDLFGSQTLQDLDNCGIDNYDLLLAIKHLSLYEDKGQLRRVNYAALDVEELGSVYESLLDFNPQIRQNNGIFEFILVSGSDRKTTGSYYTPPQLVQQLIKTALEPVIEDKLKNLTPQPPSLQGKGENILPASSVLPSSPALSPSSVIPPSSVLPPSPLRRGAGGEVISSQEQALLSIKVIDPACGSGHFLLAAARRIGKELAKVRTGEAQPAPEPLRQAVRDVIQNCIYGVDLNPLAVDLCKVALWIEGFATGRPLNFLDHRIKCGNSLVGVLDLDCLNEGIPEDAFKAVTGDDKKLSTDVKKRNKKERGTDLQGQLSLFNNIEVERDKYIGNARELADFTESTPQDVKKKEEKYQELRKIPGWWRDFSACNLWTAAFFMTLTEQNLQLLPTTAALVQVLNGNLTNQKLIDAANNLAREKYFFHWPLEFPEVFEDGGFSCVLGNPPWERIKLQEKEFFASRNLDIANAQNKAAREKLIKELPKKNPALAQSFEDAKHDAEAQSKFIRESGRFPLTAVGDINTYAVFAETTRCLINDLGRVGVIVPTGIATDDTCKRFFGDLIQKQNLASLYDFENRGHLFTALHTKTRFSILHISKSVNNNIYFSFMSKQVNDLNNKQKIIVLSSKDINFISPNTGSCPMFRTNKDAELTKKIYQNVPVLENEKTGINPWGISFMRMFDMANDSGLFHTQDPQDTGLLKEVRYLKVPLYEAKMFYIYNHRHSYYTEEMLKSNQTDFREIEPATIDDLQNPNFSVKPRYWVDKQEVENKLAGKWDKNWLLGFRDITNSTNERTAIFSLLPKVGIGNNSPVILTDVKEAKLISCLLANFCSLTFDFVTRHKVGGTHMNFFIVKQLPVIPPEKYTEKDIEYITPRVLELVYTSWDMQPFAQDMGYNREPFIWNPNKRALIRAELDAYYAKLYGLTRDELRYILDPADVYGAEFPSETFRVLKNNEIKQYGEYRTQRLVLEAWDRM
ncbi:restriction endonuclease [Anabaena sp. FACHB-1237]|uniref:Eco57I restriction-modification methylase domain-containing protein n=1 Tax=Anabaena sp. FACHB-1237 TaxID=2692769 RepID=UPI001680F2A5|nr:DNA methyltransferase [Anabaena sp. FACHB-1237]MBD2138380.1 restriction endonuclease [Anabaena sp. FACHB-1237]